MTKFKPLEDVSVIDLTRLLPGPYGTVLLGDLGAEVVKVENPEEGDYLRDLGAPNNGLSKCFELLNKNKQSVAINLKEEEGKEIFYELVEAADVVVESFRPGVVDKLGIDYETVKQHNEDIIYCSMTGYGQFGPYSDLSGHDINYMAISGILDLNGRKGEDPVVPGTVIADMAGGAFLCLSVMAALFQNEGTYIDVSLSDVVTTWTIPYIFHLFGGGDAPKRGETRHQKYPSYGIYETADGGYIALSAVEDKFWASLCQALGLEHYSDESEPAQQSTRDEIQSELSALFKERSRDEWVEFGAEQDVPISPVTELAELENNPHHVSRDLIVENKVVGKGFRFPVLFEDDLDEFRREAPKLGEQTTNKLEELGLSSEYIKELRDSGVLK